MNITSDDEALIELYTNGKTSDKRYRSLPPQVIKGLNPNQSLEAKHILFYYRADCLTLERRRSGLRQVTKTDKMPIRK